MFLYHKWITFRAGVCWGSVLVRHLRIPEWPLCCSPWNRRGNYTLHVSGEFIWVTDGCWSSFNWSCSMENRQRTECIVCCYFWKRKHENFISEMFVAETNPALIMWGHSSLRCSCFMKKKWEERSVDQPVIIQLAVPLHIPHECLW